MMPMGASLSRWTMCYFGAALLFLLFAEVLLSTGSWAPSVDVSDPRALIVVHSVTIGWLALLMIGALLQFAPVLTGLSLPKGRYDVLGLGGIVAGLALLLLGFHLIDRGSELAGVVMLAAVATLAPSLSWVGTVLLLVLWRGRKSHPASPLVLIAIGCLAATAALGSLFAVTVSGVSQAPVFIVLLLHGVPFHASFGLGGWMTLAAIGVSYKLLPMFLLSDDMKRAQLIAKMAAVSIVVLAVATAISLTWPTVSQWLLAAAAIVFAVAIAIYVLELISAYKGRRRGPLEVNMSGSLPAFTLLGLSILMLATGLASNVGSHFLAAAAYLFVFGWLTGLGLAQLLKIIPFLTWIEVFGPLLGRRQTPRLSDLVSGGRAAIWLWLFYGAVVVASFAISLAFDGLFRVAVILQTFSTAALIIELVLARSLANIDASMKTAPFKKPALLFAVNQRGNANGSAS